MVLFTFCEANVKFMYKSEQNLQDSKDLAMAILEVGPQLQ